MASRVEVRWYRGVERQYRFALTRALTATARQGQAAARRGMERSFDRPTRFTLNSMFVRPARRDTPVAEVAFREFAGKGTPAFRYLRPQIHGGGRSLKRFERALEATGVLPAGMMMAPGWGVRLNRAGNVSQGQIVQILSALRASPDPMQNSRTPGGYFILRDDSGMPIAIAQRRGRRVRTILHIIRPPTYSRRFDFYGIVIREARQRFGAEMSRALAHALATARS